MNASMKREFGCTSVTVLGGTCSRPGSRKSGASSMSRSDIGAGNCGCARYLLFDSGSRQSAQRARRQSAPVAGARSASPARERGRRSGEWIRGERPSPDAPSRPRGTPPSAWARRNSSSMRSKRLDLCLVDRRHWEAGIGVADVCWRRVSPVDRRRQRRGRDTPDRHHPADENARRTRDHARSTSGSASRSFTSGRAASGSGRPAP